MFGGGGYGVNPGTAQRNYGLVGLAVTRSFSKRLNLGIEVYHETPQAPGGPAVTNLGFGAIYQLTGHWALLASGGPGLQAPGRSETTAFYASLQFTTEDAEEVGSLTHRPSMSVTVCCQRRWTKKSSR